MTARVKMAAAVAGIAAVTAVVNIAATTDFPRPLDRVTVSFGNGIAVDAEVAASAGARSRGLSGRETLAEGEGLLFLFEAPGPYGFWMKDMRFPIDIIWIQSGRVIGVAADLPAPRPGEAPMTAQPPSDIDAVLEAPAGFARRADIRAGVQVRW